jgi:hypothetical protein
MIPPYRYERPHDPPPPPELIDALADQPLAPEIAECETCAHLADCRSTYRAARQFARPECSRALTRILPRDENVSGQLVIAALRQAPGTVHQVAERTAIVEMTVYKILARLREQGHVSGGRAARGRQPAATYSLREAQPCP